MNHVRRSVKQVGIVGLVISALAIMFGAAPVHAASRGTPSRLDVVVAIDNSQRLDGPRYSAARRSAIGFLSALPTDARTAVIAFGSFPQTVRDLSANVTGSKTVISGLGLDSDGSQLFEALSLAVETFDQTSDSYRQLVVVTDGLDGTSQRTLSEAMRGIDASKIHVNVIDINAAAPDAQKTAVLNQLAGPNGTIVKADDAAGLRAIAVRSRLDAIVKPPSVLRPGFVTRLFSNTLVLLVGMAFIFGALLTLLLQLTAAKPQKLNLTGYDVAPKVVKTPVAGISRALTDLADRKLEQSGKSRSLNVWLERAAINLRSAEFLILSAVIALVCGMLGWLRFGSVGFPLFVLIGAFGCKFYVDRSANKRSKKFGDQLSDTLQLLSSSMRAGQGLVQALDSVAREGESPTKEEFHRVVVETRLGRDLVESLKSLAERLRCVDLEWVIPAVEINRDVGGDLAEVLEQVGNTIRDRADLRRQVKTLSAEGRLSAVVLIGMPIVLGLFIKLSNPDYISKLFSGQGLYLLGGGSLLMLIGSIWLFNLCKIEF